MILMMLLLLASDPTTWISFIYDSPVLVAIITVFLVKVLDVVNERIKVWGTDHKDIRGELWKRVNDLETTQKTLNAQNDALIIKNADLGARVSLLESQNALQASELASVKHERDLLHAEVVETREILHRTKLELNEATVRIQQLGRYVRELEAKLGIRH